MPAVRDVGARLIAPACLTNCKPGSVHKLLQRAIAAGPFASSTVAGVRKAG